MYFVNVSSTMIANKRLTISHKPKKNRNPEIKE